MGDLNKVVAEIDGAVELMQAIHQSQRGFAGDAGILARVVEAMLERERAALLNPQCPTCRQSSGGGI